MSIKMGSIDNNDNASFCLSRQVCLNSKIGGTMMQPISNDTKSSRYCR